MRRTVLRPPSLRARLSAITATGAIVVLGVTALVVYRDLSGQLSSAITEELTIRVDDLAKGVENGSTPPGSALVAAQTVSTQGEVLAPAGADPLLTKAELAEATQHQIIIDRPVPAIGNEARLLARPISGSGNNVVVGVAATSTTPLSKARERSLRVLAIAGPLLTAAVAVAAWVVTGAALRPVRRMAGEAA
ncbi:MAG TPA: hypothetical protein VFR22_14205, partial [Nocardioidaceae bacterium]|nr:hypothetical protein [Nocardioidaceae bacterium]